jgi:hypothetical protein
VEEYPKTAAPNSEGAVLNETEVEFLLRLTALAEASRRKSPTREEIELRAYHIFLDRGGAHGHDVEDWMRAQRELLDKNAARKGDR